MPAHLTDFGLAKAVATGSKYTRTGQALGTPAYMSPEQARGEVSTLTPATDVWALGCILHELLAGQRAFGGDTPAEVIAQLLTGEPPALARVRPDVPRALTSVLSACLAKSAGARYPHAGAVRDDLDRVLQGARPLVHRRRRPALAAAVVAAGLVTVTAGLGALGRGRTEPLATDAARAFAHAWGRRHDDLAAATRGVAQALGAEPAQHRWRIALGLLYWAAEGVDDAVAAWRAVPGEAPEATRAAWLTGLALAAGSVTAEDRRLAVSAREAWQIAARGAGADARWARAGLAFYAEELDAARHLLDTEADWEPAALLAIVELRAWVTTGTWRSDTVRRAFDRVLTDGLPFVWGYTARGLARENLGDLEGAEADYDTALRRRPESLPPRRNRAQLRRERGDLAGAVADAEFVIARAPDDFRAWLTRGLARYAMGDLPDATSDLTAALARQANLPDAHATMAKIHEARGDLPAAEAAYDAVLALTPDRATSRLNRARLRLLRGDPAGTIADCDAVLAHQPADVLGRTFRALARDAQGDHVGAIADLDVAIEAAPTDVGLRHNRGRIRGTLGQLDAALADFDAVLAAVPGRVDSLFGRGEVHRLRGDFAASARDFEAALAAAPEAWPNRQQVERLLEQLRRRQ